MKIHSFISVLTLVSIALFSCEKPPQNPDTDSVPKDIEVSSVSLNESSVTLFKGNTITLVATVKPDNATDKKVTWSTSDASVATVNSGAVTALKTGAVTITAQAGGKSTSCQITVVEATFEFTMSSHAATLQGAGGSATAKLSAEGNWTLSSDASWLSVSPSSGGAGESEVQLTSSENTSGESRKANIVITASGVTQRFELVQRPIFFTRTKVSSGRVTNGVSFIYDGSKFTRIYMVLPRPVSNYYQEITNWEAPGCTEGSCPDGINKYIWRDVSEDEIPVSGGFVISESFDANVYHVVTDFSKITDIPEYDASAQECQKYLGKEEGGYIDPTHSKIASTANSLWGKSFGNVITYARKCHDWTYENITYGNMNTGLHTIANLMQTMTGDCGNYVSVFISLLRAKGIPARHIEMVHGQKDEYHVRAEFYVPAYGWIPADPTWGPSYFGVFDGNYIVTTQGINTVVRNPEGKDFMATLLQSYHGWWWWQTEGSFSFRHSCTGLR